MPGKANKVSSLAVRVGMRLRSTRTERGYTLSALAKETDLSEAFLSRLERGLASASVASLVQLTGKLGLSMQKLFDDDAGPLRTRVAVHRSSEKAALIAASGYRWKRLAGNAPNDNMDVFQLVFPPRARMKLMVSHPGQEHCFVLSGEIAFFVGGERFHLKSGDGILFAAEQPHRVDNLGASAAVVLMTVARAGHAPTSMEWWRALPRSKEIVAPPKAKRASVKEEAS
jgi:transcriptional regulator with XRE-family HTH domain